MEHLQISPYSLIANPWNSNRVPRDAFEKLKKSLDILGAFKEVTVRTLNDGSYQILAGFHRVEAAKELGWGLIPVCNLGDISDQKAKEISLIDNTRYGEDDKELLEKLLSEMETETLEIVLPETEELELPETDTEIKEEETPEEKDEEFKTLRFRLETDKAEEIEFLLNKVARENDYKLIDGYNDLPLALYHILIMEK